MVNILWFPQNYILYVEMNMKTICMSQIIDASYYTCQIIFKM